MTKPNTRVLVTGAQGFIGKNLVVRLGERSSVSVCSFVRDTDVSTLPDLVAAADLIIHLAGENRPQDERAFKAVNTDLTILLCDAVRNENNTRGRKVPLLLASSSQAESDSAYGQSKLAAEQAVTALTAQTGNPTVVFRLPGIFGKWCKPHYNSVVATFCHNIARGLPIQINDPDTRLRLAYVDDVVSTLIAQLDTPLSGTSRVEVMPVYEISLGALAAQIERFESGRPALEIDNVGAGLTRALYATYVSHLPPAHFTYDVHQHCDPRGRFVEMLKTPDCGQFSYFTAHPGVTRGGHYHHTKVEKFLVIKGRAHFQFKHLLTGELIKFQTSGEKSQVVESIPGWTHDITNVGDDELIVMLWANEVFDSEHPDTISKRI